MIRNIGIEQYDKNIKKIMIGKQYVLQTLHEGTELFLMLTQNKIPSMLKPIVFHKLLFNIKILHDNNFIHGDVKPENFILNISDIKINTFSIDFGFSEKLNNNETEKKVEHIRGTKTYAAPEIFNKTISKKIDIFALGTIHSLFKLNYPWALKMRTIAELRYDIDKTIEKSQMQLVKLSHSLSGNNLIDYIKLYHENVFPHLDNIEKNDVKKEFIKQLSKSCSTKYNIQKIIHNLDLNIYNQAIFNIIYNKKLIFKNSEFIYMLPSNVNLLYKLYSYYKIKYNLNSELLFHDIKNKFYNSNNTNDKCSLLFFSYLDLELNKSKYMTSIDFLFSFISEYSENIDSTNIMLKNLQDLNPATRLFNSIRI